MNDSPAHWRYTSPRMIEAHRKSARAIFLVFAIYCIAWFDLFMPGKDPASGSEPSLRWFLVSAAKNAARFGLVRFIAAREASAGRFQSLSIKSAVGATSILRSLGVSAAALAVAFAARVFWARGMAAQPGLGSEFASLPALSAILASCLAVGYAEEGFFRFFAVDTLAGAGLPEGAAIGIPALLFGLSHISQGWFAVPFAICIALIFQVFRKRGCNLHSLAWGHAFYDFAILLSSIVPSGAIGA